MFELINYLISYLLMSYLFHNSFHVAFPSLIVNKNLTQPHIYVYFLIFTFIYFTFLFSNNCWFIFLFFPLYLLIYFVYSFISICLFVWLLIFSCFSFSFFSSTFPLLFIVYFKVILLKEKDRRILSLPSSRMTLIVCINLILLRIYLFVGLHFENR